MIRMTFLRTAMVLSWFTNYLISPQDLNRYLFIIIIINFILIWHK